MPQVFYQIDRLILYIKKNVLTCKECYFLLIFADSNEYVEFFCAYVLLCVCVCVVCVCLQHYTYFIQ